MIRALIAAALALALLGCSDDRDTPEPTTVSLSPTLATAVPTTPFPAPTISLTPRPSADTAPSGTRTGDTDIDAIVSVIESKDAATLAPLLQLREVPCTWEQGLGGPPKCSDALNEPPEDTPVPAFPILHCEGGWSYDTDAASRLIFEREYELHSIHALSLSGPMFDEPYFPQPQYVLVLVGAQMVPPTLIYMQDGKIVMTQTSCDPLLPPEELLGRLRGEIELLLRGPAFDE